MKKTINTLEAALIMDLETLYCAELKLEHHLPPVCEVINSDAIRDVFRKYIHSCADKILKLNRTFSYLNHEPISCSVSVMNELIDEVFKHIAFASDGTVQDLLLIGCLQRINNYKISLYSGCLEYAAELELETPVDLLSSVIQWEREIEAVLKKFVGNSLE